MHCLLLLGEQALLLLNAVRVSGCCALGLLQNVFSFSVVLIDLLSRYVPDVSDESRDVACKLRELLGVPLVVQNNFFLEEEGARLATTGTVVPFPPIRFPQPLGLTSTLHCSADDIGDNEGDFCVSCSYLARMRRRSAAFVCSSGDIWLKNIAARERSPLLADDLWTFM